MSNWIFRKSGKTKRKGDVRDPFDIDYSRIIHSSSFRRLQGKTQILNLGDNDFYRTRLTHSLEVSQIAGGILKSLNHTLETGHEGHAYLPPLSLVQTLGLGHDLGHPPFGHGGEVALNYCMRDHGGFEGNGHTLRLISKLEVFSEENGADLTRRTLLGLLKYPVAYSRLMNANQQPCLSQGPSVVPLIDPLKCVPPKAYLDSEQDVVSWILSPLCDADQQEFTAFFERKGRHSKAMHKSLDCSIMDAADDIAYGVHDLEDAIELGFISEAQFRAVVDEKICSAFLNEHAERYGQKTGNNIFDSLVSGLFGDGAKRKMYISMLVGHFIEAVELIEINRFKEPLLRFRVQIKPGSRDFLNALQELVAQQVIFSPNVQQLEFKGQQMVVKVFEVVASAPQSFLPREHFRNFERSQGDMRVICDYIAEMSDGTLLKTYDRLFSPRMGSIFDHV
ncbi:anti-phage deoxyguanosine triphosphatase [Polycladidibacter stylochi]|uniref:anti-phage deoxyguanosine triphosphatase n=1 Tax=Polycladidibacter stylochi TaxID=1807766 RepID=UPI000834E16D|nr:anti-phage deoxyguanosine triphosphatase [Pseudovibrio stylochi]